MAFKPFPFGGSAIAAISRSWVTMERATGVRQDEVPLPALPGEPENPRLAYKFLNKSERAFLAHFMCKAFNLFAKDIMLAPDPRVMFVSFLDEVIAANVVNLLAETHGPHFLQALHSARQDERLLSSLAAMRGVLQWISRIIEMRLQINVQIMRNVDLHLHEKL